MAAKGLLMIFIAMVAVGVVAVDTGVGHRNGWKIHSGQKQWDSNVMGLHAGQERADSMLIPMLKSDFKLMGDEDPCSVIGCSTDGDCSLAGCDKCEDGHCAQK